MYNKKISNKDCIDILDSIKKNHDAEIGINWLVIEDAIYQHIEQNKELLNLEMLIDKYDYFDKDGYIIGSLKNIKNLDEHSKEQLKIDFKECFYKVK
ncbi:MAG: hypothetical protein JW924_00645 [Fusobacteriaceae bacterium]|nr:hypothetical protein [Fusobacteriaceae bacterium]